MPIIHVTPGLLDIRSITTFGLHAKPGSSAPIGKFGTGLKYAIATLLRLGCKIQLFIGETEYEFYTKKDDFRGMEYEQVYMKKRKGVLSRWSSIELPFTTLHGKFWEAWQAFRELHSNTLDENGSTELTHAPGVSALYTSDKTIFVITGEKYEEAFQNIDSIFLPKALTQREGDTTVQVFNEPSKYLYWRGIRVFDLEKPSIYTYNILEDMELTEDRTLKYVWQAQSKIAAYVARSKDQKLINAVVSAQTEKHFEGRLDWDYAYATPSEQFNEVLAKKKARGSYISPRALGYYDRYAPVTHEPKVLSTKEWIEKYAYDPSLPSDVQALMKHLLKCVIHEPEETPAPYDGDIPF